jgi:hypothetical protein
MEEIIYKHKKSGRFFPERKGMIALDEPIQSVHIDEYKLTGSNNVFEIYAIKAWAKKQYEKVSKDIAARMKAKGI